MLKSTSIICVITCALFVAPGTTKILGNNDRCSSLSCIHGSASILELIDPDVLPCDDFYGYACGNFVEEIYTPDEKSTLDTLSLMNDKLVEYLLTLFSKPKSDSDPKLHHLSKTMFDSCSDSSLVNNRSKSAMLDILAHIQGFPMLDGPSWDEKKWDWNSSIANLRKHISHKEDDIFKKNKIDILYKASEKGHTEDELKKIKTSLEPLMLNVVVELGVSANATHISKDIDDLIKFEETLAEYFYKNKVFVKGSTKRVPNFNAKHKKILWMELFAPSLLTIVTKFNGTLEANFIDSYNNFLIKTPKRVMANYVGWRLLQTSLGLMHLEMRNIFLKFEKYALGKEDLDQRWKLCALLTQNEAAVATGAMYVEGYFKKKDKKVALELVDNLYKEYLTTIENSGWMNEQTKISAKKKAMEMKKYIGYEDQLINEEGKNYYNDLYEYEEDKFLEMVLAFKIFETDREYKYIYVKNGTNTSMINWSKYSKPATINAYYKSEDNSIQFPAAILQAPNFDRGRPEVMNFGAIGSVIGHEMTHAFDDLAEKKDGWSANSTQEYMKNLECIVNQYNNYSIDREDHYVKIDYKTDGRITLKENVADCGGVKLAYNAYKKWANKKTQKIPIGLTDYSNEQIFWLSFAQTYCAVERPVILNNKEVKGLYALNRFRVIGPIQNMKEFANDFNCPANSRMNPEKRCALW